MHIFNGFWVGFDRKIHKLYSIFRDWGSSSASSPWCLKFALNPSAIGIYLPIGSCCSCMDILRGILDVTYIPNYLHVFRFYSLVFQIVLKVSHLLCPDWVGLDWVFGSPAGLYSEYGMAGSICWIHNPVQCRHIWIGLDQTVANSADSALDWIEKCTIFIPYLRYLPSIGLTLGHAGNFVPPWKNCHNWKLLQILKWSVHFLAWMD